MNSSPLLWVVPQDFTSPPILSPPPLYSSLFSLSEIAFYIVKVDFTLYKKFTYGKIKYICMP
jgi:hypothetical protein